MILFLLLMLLPISAHAFVADIAGAIVDAMQPTSTNHDGDNDGDSDDD